MGLKAVAGINQSAVAITGGSITTVTGAPYILAESFAAVTTAADTNENTAATITVPANALGANGLIRLAFKTTATNNGNVKTLRARFSGIGGTIVYSAALVSTPGGSGYLYLANANATNAQTAWGQFTASAGGLVAVTSATSAIDTTAGTTLVVTLQKATGSDTTTLDGYVAEVLRIS